MIYSSNYTLGSFFFMGISGCFVALKCSRKDLWHWEFWKRFDTGFENMFVALSILDKICGILDSGRSLWHWEEVWLQLGFQSSCNVFSILPLLPLRSYSYPFYPFVSLVFRTGALPSSLIECPKSRRGTKYLRKGGRA